MLLYKKEYNKTKELYNESKTANYKFKYFNEHKSQISFIKKHEDSIINIISGCIPLNTSIQNKIGDLNEYIKHYILSLAYNSPETNWYFVTENDTVISLCHVNYDDVVYKTKKSYDTYKIYNSNTDNLSYKMKKIKPVLYNLCKSPNYAKAGEYLLKNIFEYYKEKKYDVIYLIQESILFKDNYSNIFKINTCKFVDINKYIESNDKLSKYYIKMGMTQLKNHYDIYHCKIYDEYQSDIIFFKIFYKTLI